MYSLIIQSERITRHRSIQGHSFIGPFTHA